MKKAPTINVNYCVLLVNRKQYLVTCCDNSSSRYVNADHNRGNSCHAEMKALKIWMGKHYKSSKLRSLRHIEIYSLRAKLNESGNIVLSFAKPCLRCHQSLTKWGIKNIYYSNHDGHIVQCQPDDVYELSGGDRRLRENNRHTELA